MKRNIVQMTTNNKYFRLHHYNSMCHLIYLYNNLNPINIKRIQDPYDSNFIFFYK